MKKYLIVIALIMSAWMMESCGSAKKACTWAELEGEWKIESVDGKAVKAGNEPFLGFKVADKQLYGNAGCNSLMGTLEMDEENPGTLSFGALGSTRRLCADAHSEEAIMQALAQVKRFAWDDHHRLVLTDADGHARLLLSARTSK